MRRLCPMHSAAPGRLVDESVERSVERSVVLAVAGSDSAGLAGLAMDIRVQTALGVHCAAALSANTAQNGQGVLASNPVATAQFQLQLAAAASLNLRVVKAGMLATAEQVQALCDWLQHHPLPLIYDPVLNSSSGHALGEAALPDVILRQLLGLCELITPNVDEASQLTGMPVATVADVERVAQHLVARGARAVLIKGGHLRGTQSQDFFLSPEQAFWLSSPRYSAAQRDGGGNSTGNTRGTGCALASAIAAARALGYALPDAVVIGKMAINQGLRQAYRCAGAGSTVHITAFPDAPEDLPTLQRQPDYRVPPAFPDCGAQPLGLYPIVDRAAWLERLLPLGVSTIQLRIKDLHGAALLREIDRAVAISRQAGCRLFINDHWREAIAAGAYGVHLGQEDLLTADLPALRQAGLRLGVSSHCHYEVAAARAVRPSYIACGPVYPTETKCMPWVPQGAAGLRYWRGVLPVIPLVAIGGINLARCAEVLAAGADGVALISAITGAADPEVMTRQLLSVIQNEPPVK